MMEPPIPMPKRPVTLDGLDVWGCVHNPGPSVSYGKGWWDSIEFMQMLRDHHGLEAVDVPATYLMETPPPCATLLMPVDRRSTRAWNAISRQISVRCRRTGF
jgi:hypothetical protein